jgi:hypothetical protein
LRLPLVYEKANKWVTAAKKGHGRKVYVLFFILAFYDYLKSKGIDIKRNKL